MSIQKAFMNFPILKTDRCILRKINETDAEDFSGLYNSPEVIQFLDWDGPGTPDIAKIIIRFFEEQYSRQEYLRWAVADKLTGRMIGTCLFGKFIKNSIAEIGYDLKHEFWNKGIMTEVLTEVIRFGFEEMGLHRIQALVRPGNLPSFKLLEKLNFTQEGRLRDFGYHESRREFFDVYLFSILKNELSKQGSE